MLVHSVFLFAAIVGAIMEKCETRYFLVKIGDAEERTSLAKSNLSVDLLKELNVAKGNRRESVEWLHFLHLKRKRYIGNPKITTRGLGLESDGGNLCPAYDRRCAGEHEITDIEGNSLKLSDVKDGMFVKIRARNVHLDDCDYLYTSEYYPIWGYCYYDKNRKNTGTKTHEKQRWKVVKGLIDSTFLFESTFWSNGNYLSGNDGDWLYVYTFLHQTAL